MSTKSFNHIRSKPNFKSTWIMIGFELHYIENP